MNWATAPLSEIATIERNAISPADIVSGSRYVGLDHIESGGGSIRFGSVENGELASSKFRFGPNHILFGKLRPYLAKVACPDFAGICSTDIVPISPGKRVDKRYLLHFLRRPETIAWAAGRATGVNLPRLSPNELASLRIPLPPLDEQRRIAAILDKADALRRKRKRAIELIDRITQSIFFELFGHTSEEVLQWGNPVALADLADIGSGITKGRKLNGHKTREVPYMAVVNVQDRRLDLSSVKTIEASEEEISRYRLADGDLLLTEGGDPDKLGRGTLWAGELPEAIHQNHIFRVRVRSDSLLPLFLNWLVSSPYGKRYFLNVAKQTTGIASINKTQLSQFPTIVPPIEVQQRFVDVANAVAAETKHLHSSSNNIDFLFSSLQHRAFSGQL